MKIDYAYIGRNEWRGFSGSKQISLIKEISGKFIPIVKLTLKKTKGLPLPSLEAATAWVVLQLNREAKKLRK